MPKKCLTKCSKTVGVGIVTVRKAHLELLSLNSSGKVVKGRGGGGSEPKQVYKSLWRSDLIYNFIKVFPT